MNRYYIPWRREEETRDEQPQLQLEIYPPEWYLRQSEIKEKPETPTTYEIDYSIDQNDVNEDTPCERVIIIDMN